MRENLKKCLALIVNYILICACTQLKSTSDSANEVFVPDDFADSIVSKVAPKWYSGEPTFVLKQNSGEVSPHLFFDVSPDIDMDNNTLSFIVTTPKNSSYAYSIDLLSGQHFLDKPYCEQSDIWNRYSEMITKPPYTAGIIPKILDQIGEPQKIIVFGDEEYYKKNFTENSFDAKVVGGFIEQVCPRGGCRGRGEWSSRIVLIGVQRGHEKFQKIKTIRNLKTVVDWPKVKAFVQNGQGQNHIVGSYFPAFRFGAELSVDQALSYLNKNSIYLKDKKMKGIQNSCHKLYNHIWNKVGIDSTYEKTLRSLKLKTKRKEYIEKNKLKRNTFFFNRFKDSFQKYHKEYKTCLKYVYPSNINENPKRHWFFAHYSAVHLLHDLDYSYNCSRLAWKKNYKLNNGKNTFALKNEFKQCDAKRIDTMFEHAIPFLDRLRRQGNASYRYVDYDKGGHGTHKKIYSWVKVTNKVFQCENKVKSKWINTFPKDIRWKRKRLRVNRRGMIIK